MFVPDETFIRVAQEHDSTLSEDGWKVGVILASPSTLFTLLRTVAATWQQETVAQSAREVHELGRELYGRIATMAKHLGDAGKALDNAVGHYNSAVGSLETRVLVQARRFEQHGIEGDIPAPQPIERQARPLQAPELVEPGEQLRAIDAA
jgi:DNA recombination protein RmuC